METKDKDLKYLEIIDAWVPDDETQTEYNFHKEDSIYAYVAVLDGGRGGIAIYLGKSWKEIYEHYFKDAILEYLNDEGDTHGYFTEEQIAFIDQN